jgi:hypothetical protein
MVEGLEAGLEVGDPVSQVCPFDGCVYCGDRRPEGGGWDVGVFAVETVHAEHVAQHVAQTGEGILGAVVVSGHRGPSKRELSVCALSGVRVVSPARREALLVRRSRATTRSVE